MEATATAKFVRMGPRKVRFVLDTVRGKYAPEALAQLQFTPNHAAVEIAKVIKSACANAANNFGMNGDHLKIVKCYVDGGPTLKRVHPRAQGRAYRILKRTSHITVIVGEVERPVVNPKGIAKPVAKRQPLRAPLPGQTSTPVPSEPVETIEETAMNVNAPATEEVAATVPEATLVADTSADAPVETIPATSETTDEEAQKA